MRTRWLCLLAVVVGIGLPVQGQPQTNEVPLLVEMLSHPAPGYRTRAASALESLGAAAAPALVEELRTGPIGGATRAAVVLRKMDARAASVAPDLINLLGTPCEDWRWNVAVQVLGKISPESLGQALPHLIQGLRGGALRQHGALMALQLLKEGGAAAIPELQALLARPRWTMHSVVLDDTVVNNRTVAWTMGTRPYDDLVIVETLLAVGAPPQDVVVPLEWMTFSQLPSLRLESAGWLVKRGTPDSLRWAIPALTSLLEDRHYGVREAAVKYLGMAGPNAVAATPELTRMLLRPDAVARREAAIALGNVGPGAAAALPLLKKTAVMQRLVDPISARPYEDAIAKIEMSPPAK